MKGRRVNLFLSVILAASCSVIMSCGGGSSQKKETTKPAIDWVSIPAGTFMMGSPATEPGRAEDETQHEVTLNAFKMSKTEVTVAQFKAFVDATGYKTDAEKGTDGYKGSVIWNNNAFEKKDGASWRCDVLGNPLNESDYNQPVVHVSWNDAQAFAAWMGCRLPTESEWEYAARAGSTTMFYTGNCLGADVINYNGNFSNMPCPKGQYRAKTTAVGSFAPNNFGLCDMHGNVWEWCSDFYGAYPSGPQNNPKGAATGANHVLRGGSWRDNSLRCRSAYRDKFNAMNRFDFVGIRLVSMQ